MGVLKNRVGVAVGAVAACLLLLVGLWAAGMFAAKEPMGQGERVPSPTVASAPSPPRASTPDPYAEDRERMVEYDIRSRGVTDSEVLRAMQTVPRHEFVPDEYLDMAYSDRPLPIDYGQTISQPYIVALMTELLELKRGDKVLEIGTGSGYQAAILAEITDQVYTVEIIPGLAESASQRLLRLGYDDIHTLNADGYYGWGEYAPYDAIIVTAAPDHVPQPLINQLKEGGRMVIPVGPVGWVQTLWLVTKVGGEVEFHNKGGVTFVPLTGEH